MVSSDNNVAVSRHSRIEMVLAQQYCYMQILKLIKQHSGTVNSINNLQANAHKGLNMVFITVSGCFPSSVTATCLQCWKYSLSFKLSPRDQNELSGEGLQPFPTRFSQQQMTLSYWLHRRCWLHYKPAQTFCPRTVFFYRYHVEVTTSLKRITEIVVFSQIFFVISDKHSRLGDGS